MELKTQTAQQDVLKVYLDSLLQEVLPEVDELKPTVKEEVSPEPAPTISVPVKKVVIPAWATTEFESLLFTAGGLKLSIPLVKSNGILAWDSVDLTPMPGHKLWYLGIIIHQGKHVKVIDVLNFVTPSSYKVKPPKDRLQNIVLIEDANWGLACDSITGTLALQRDGVRWRTNRSKRPWLAGTVIEQMCALIDTDEFVRLLSNN